MLSTNFLRPMEYFHQFMLLLALFGMVFAHQYKAQSPGASTSATRSLDALLQDYAYQALGRPRTGVPYDGAVPSNLTGIKIAALRLRSGSLRRKGVQSYKEFQIPDGIIVQPNVQRLVLVYQNLGNWSSLYYPLPGFTYLTPVLGLLAYDAANLSSTNLPELDIMTTKLPISINFTSSFPVTSGEIAKCVSFSLNGSTNFRVLESSDVCFTHQQGHFGIVVNSSVSSSPAPSEAPVRAPSPIGSKNIKSKVWKIVVIVVGGIVALLLFALLVYCMLRYKQKKKVAWMEQQADTGVSLHIARVGNAQIPVASETRTQPVLENELVATVASL